MARRNGFLDAIQSFNAAYDTVEKVGKGFEQARAMRETPQESQGYTATDGEMLRNIAEARDAEGNLAYQLEARPDNTYGLKVRGQDGTYTPVDGPGIAPGTVTDFMGKRTAGTMDQGQIDRARYSKIADIEAKYDPRAALQMRRELANQDREDKRFSWDEQAQPIKLRAAELGLKSGERTERQGERGDMIQQLDDAVAQMPRDALEVYASKLNTNDSPYPMLYTGQTKDGFKFVTTDPATGKPSGKEFVLNEAQLRQMASASVLGMAGYGQESIARLSSVNKEMADHIKTWNDAISKSATSENDARYKGGQLAIDQQKANSADAARRATIGLAQQRAAMDRMGAAKYFEGDDGKIYASIPTMGKGGLTFQTVPVNPDGVGLKVPGRPASGTQTKPVKVPEAGEKFMVDGQLKVTDGQGGYIDPKGVMPEMRGATLKKAGIPDEIVGQLPWNSDGTRVLFGDMAYDVRDQKDMRALREDYKRLAGNTVAVTEANLEDHHTSNNLPRGYGPELTGLPPRGMPSIYAGPDAWEAYRNQQGR